MLHQDCIEEFAGLFQVEKPEAELLLTRFSSAMAAELLAARKLSLKGLGSFTVTHFPAEKKSSASTVVYTPPGNRLTFTSKLLGVDDTMRMAVARLSMRIEEAERFGEALSALFRRAIQQQRDIRLNGIGRFTLEQGAYLFFPERSLEVLLNREYHDLQELVLPSGKFKQGSGVKRALRYLVPLSVCAIAALLFAFFSGREPKPPTIPSPSTVKPVAGVIKTVDRGKRPAAEVHTDSLTLRKPVAPLRSSEESEANGSLVLAPDSYTIVLVTLRKSESVHKEVLRLRSEGVKAFVWPAEANGITYYRLITGSFSSRQAAAERLGQMAQKSAGGAYSQHIIKRVVLHEEKVL